MCYKFTVLYCDTPLSIASLQIILPELQLNMCNIASSNRQVTIQH